LAAVVAVAAFAEGVEQGFEAGFGTLLGIDPAHAGVGYQTPGT
jgi:hypothetical protein